MIFRRTSGSSKEAGKFVPGKDGWGELHVRRTNAPGQEAVEEEQSVAASSVISWLGGL